MNFFKPAVLAAVSTLALNASATTTDWFTHDLLEVAAAITPVGAFEDTYLFTLASANSAMSTTVSNNLSGVLGLTDGNVALYMEAGAVDVAMGNYAFNDVTGSISYDFGALAAGSYYYAVTGMGTGSAGGFYTLSSTVSPIPEPESYALMLAGLGVMGLLLKRSANQR
jgi:hypothetical protein